LLLDPQEILLSQGRKGSHYDQGDARPKWCWRAFGFPVCLGKGEKSSAALSRQQFSALWKELFLPEQEILSLNFIHPELLYNF